MTDSDINKINNHILSQISKIYDGYEHKSRQMKEQSNKKTGSTIDKAESELLKRIQSDLEPDLEKLVNQMEKIKSMRKDYTSFVRSCHNSIKNILKKKTLNFKVNKQFGELYEQTKKAIKIVRQKLPVVDKTAFLCCGVDGMKQFQAALNIFRIQSGKWQMIEILQSKGSVDNFISPQFLQNQYDFVKKLLRSYWPKQKQAQVQFKQVEKIVTKYVNVEGQKKDLLDEANKYIFGINRQQNLLFGLQIYHKEADKNQNPDACAFLGKIYEEGIILTKNLAKASNYYQKSVDSKNKYAKYRYSMCIIKGVFTIKEQQSSKKSQEVKRALSFLNQIASGQEPCAQALAQLGSLYEKGYFSDDLQKTMVVGIDLKKAIQYNLKAKSYNLPRANNNLGLIYYDNKGMNPNNPAQKVDSEAVKIQNTKKALSYFYQAQKQGYPQAYYNLGVIHKDQKQVQKAYRYFYQGARKGDHLSKIKFAYELMNQTSIEKQQFEDHYRLAGHWLESVIKHYQSLENGLSAQAKHDHQSAKAQATYYLGMLYEYGFGVQKSPKRAFNYFLQAAQTGHGPAKNKIGDCYFSGYGVPLNRQLAIGCYLQASTLGDSTSMVNLGTIYLNGIPNSVERNYSKAHEFFCKSMQLQNSDAMIHLSYMYRNGLGLDNDQELAKKLLQQAAKNKNATALYMLKQRGENFNKNIYYQNLENQFFSTPKRINIDEIVPFITTIN